MFEVGLGNRFVGDEDNRYVFKRAQAVQVRSRRARCDPYERHAHVVVTKGSVQLDYRVLDRRFLRRFLYAPFFAFRAARRMEVNCVKFVNQVVVPFVGRTLRFVGGFLITPRRLCRTVSVVERGRDMVPYVAFVRAKAEYGVDSFFQVGQFVRFTFFDCQARNSRVLTVVVFVTREAFTRRFHVFFLAWDLHRNEGYVINGVMFRDVEGQVVVLAFRQRVPFKRVVIVVQARRVVLTQDDNQLVRSLVDFIGIGILRSLRPAICRGEGEEIAFRHRYFAAVRFPFQRPSIFLMRTRRNIGRVRLALQVCRDRRLIVIAVDVPR